MDFDQTIQSIGPFGKYQYRMTFMVCLAELMTAIFTLSPVFLAHTPLYWCSTPEVADNSTCTPEQLRHLTVPFKSDNDSTGYEECLRFDHDYQALTSSQDCSATFNRSSTSVIKCNDWDYVRKDMLETTITDFDLVCDRASLGSNVAGIFLMAQSVGFFIFGPVTDRFGRRFTMLVGNSIVLVSSVASALSPTYLVFLILRIVLALGIAATGSASLTLVMEYVGTQYRLMVGVLMGMMWGISPHILVAISYLSKDWRIIHYILTVPVFFITVAFYLVVTESPRWLLVVGRKEQANQVFEKMATCNGYKWDNVKVVVETKRSESVLKMLKRPKYFYISAVQYISWFVSGLVYYGITFSVPPVGSNPFVSYSIQCIIDFPCLLPLLFAFNSAGRVITLSVGNFMGGVFFLATLFVDNYWVILILTMLSKGCIASCYTGIWIYTNEVYPTSVRSASSCITYIFTRFGSTVGAYIWFLSDIYVPLPVLICGGLAILSGLVDLTLPETLGAELTQTLDEGDEFISDNLFALCRGKISKRKMQSRLKQKKMANVYEPTTDVKSNNNQITSV